MDEESRPTNIERLRSHLEDGSLAGQLVEAFRAAGHEERKSALRAVAEDRLRVLRESLDGED